MKFQFPCCSHQNEALHAVAVMLAPVMPRFAAGLADSLGGMPVEVDAGVQPFPKTVGEFRKATAWQAAT